MNLKLLYQKITDHELTTGILLMIFTTIALILANGESHQIYFNAINYRFDFLHWENLHFIPHSFQHWINDGAMVIFFLLVGFELKHEFVEGELQHPKKALLPIVGALGGMILPVLIYSLLNGFNAEHLKGWAIPMATDIAFAVGVLSLMGKSIPSSLKIFLLLLAVIDDLGAILVIAIFYTEHLYLKTLGLAILGLILMTIAYQKFKIKDLRVHIAISVILWILVYNSGIHATLLGVVLGLMIPTDIRHRLEHQLKPINMYIVLPLFALVNAGIDLSSVDFVNTVSLGVTLGLIFGKSFGIFGFCYFAVKYNIAHLSSDISYSQLFGVACLGGIGFTMSIFIAGLSFNTLDLLNTAKIGILVGSIISAILGLILLKYLSIKNKQIFN